TRTEEQLLIGVGQSVLAPPMRSPKKSVAMKAAPKRSCSTSFHYRYDKPHLVGTKLRTTRSTISIIGKRKGLPPGLKSKQQSIRMTPNSGAIHRVPITA